MTPLPRRLSYGKGAPPSALPIFLRLPEVGSPR